MYKCYSSVILCVCCFLVQKCSTNLEGNEIILLPHSTVSACPGEQLLFMCNTNATSLRWNITVPLLQDNYIIRSVIVSYTQTRMINPISISSDISFPISRLSTNGSLPLISTLSVTNVTIGLNGTKVECFTRINNIDLQRVTTINVIRSGIDAYPRRLELNSREVFRGNGTTVFLEWIQEPGVTYTANAFPPAPLRFTGSARIQLVLFYNIVYSVSITATLCGQNSVNTFLNLSYVKCSDTFQEVLMHSADRDTFLEGTNITFSCPPGLVLTGPSISTCMGNGEWEPSPNTVECKANCGVPLAKNDVTLIFNSILEGSELIFWCNESPNDTMIASCLSNGRWSVHLDDYSCTSIKNVMSRESNLIVAMVSSVILFTIIFFIFGFGFGFVFGQLWQKHKQSTETPVSKDAYPQMSQQVEHTSSTVGPIVPAEQHLEMMENVAYGPLK